MAIAITEDFVTKSGLVVQGTGTVTSSTGQTTALQVNSGAAIAKNLIVGSNATIYGDITANQNVEVSSNLFVNGGTVLSITTATSKVYLIDATTATTGGDGTLQVAGGVFLGNNLVIAGIDSSTSSAVSNALYVAGGAGIDGSLVVAGSALFHGDVIINGSTTNVYSTNTVYTDNLIELHTSPTSAWNLDDGKDIGFRFHYYSGSDKNAALVLSGDSKYLEWYSEGAESNTGTFVGGTYGTFKTGNVLVVNDSNAIDAQSGSLQVSGGVGIQKDLYVGGGITATTFAGTFIGSVQGIVTTATNIGDGVAGDLLYQAAPGETSFINIGSAGSVLLSDGSNPYWGPISQSALQYSNTATNIKDGANMEIPYQTGAGKTEFEYNFRYDYSANTLRTVNAVFTGTDNSSNATSGALQVTGGVGIGNGLYVGGNVILNGDVDVRGGDISTDQTTFNLINSNATVVNFANSATSITIGAPTGSSTIRNQTNITNTASSVSTLTGALTVAGGAGIRGNVYIGGQTFVSGNLIPTNGTISLGTQANPFADVFLGPHSLYVDTIAFSATGTTLNVISTAGATTIQAGSGIFTSSTNATSTATGALTVAGGAGIGQDLYVGGNEVLSGDLTVNGGDIATNQTTFNLLNSTATTVNFAGAGTTINIGATTGYTSIRSNNAASSTVTGALRVAGGAGIGGDLYVGGNEILTGNLAVNGGDITTTNLTSNLVNANATTVNIAGAGTAVTIGAASGFTLIRNQTTITSTVIASSTNTGALQVRGGAGIAGSLYVGGNGFINGSAIITQATFGNYGVTTLAAGTDTAISTATGNVTVWSTATLQSVTSRGSTTPSAISITNNTVATSTITGALKVVGGVGVGGRLYVGDRIVILGSTVATSTNTGALQVVGGVGIGGDLRIGGQLYAVINTATNVGGGAAGQILYQSAVNVTGFSNVGTAGQVLISQGTSAPQFVDTGTFVSGYAINVKGGNPGSILYQSNFDTTDFVGIGATGAFLRSNGSIPEYVTSSSMYIGAAVTATNVQGGAIGSMPYQSAAGKTTMLPIGTGGYLLTSNGSAPEWTALGGLSAGTATNISITNEVSSADVHYIAFMNTTTGNGGIRTSGPTKLTYTPASGFLNVGGAANIDGDLIVKYGITAFGDISVRGSDIGTSQTTFNLLNQNATTVNFAGGGTTVNIGAATGNTNVKNNLIVAGNLTVQGTTTVVDSTVTNVSDPIITLGGPANNAVVTSDDNKDRGIAFKYYSGSAKLGFFGYKDSNTFFTYIPDATITNEVVTGTKGALDVNLAGGTTNGQLVYQSAANTTAFLAAGTAGYILQANGTGSAPTWVPPASSTATNLANGTAGQIPYQTAPGLTSFVGGSGTIGQILVSNGTTAPRFQNTLTLTSTVVSNSTDTGALQVAGGVGIGGAVNIGQLSTINGAEIITTATIANFAAASSASTGTTSTFTILNATGSSSTNTGALRVLGGAGIAENVYIGGALYVTATSYINNSPIITQATIGTYSYLGPQGIQGTQGIRGYTGSQGIQGTQGITGAGFTGSQGVTGSQGIQGTSGVNGFWGSVGYTGSQGTQGLTGQQGVQGWNGNLGFTGSQGIQGTQGVQGTLGNQGIQGTIGPQGIQGTQGVIGFTGSQGIQGVQGQAGASASQGITGSQGVTGNQGIQGTIGIQGIQGTQGVQGWNGTNGFWGSVGYTGSQGIQGLTGYTGSQGIQGTTGNQGIQGSQGIRGTDGNVQGMQGIQGQFGNQGIQGSQGLTGNQGITGFTGSQGIQGVQGWSGTNGYWGSVGYTGSQGIQGPTGQQGIQGTIGTGLTGSQGITGFTGSQGIQGPQGTQGVVGYTGSLPAGALTSPTALVFTITNVTSSISTNTGALQVAGGVGVGGNLVVGGITTITNTTAATSTVTGSLQVKGGAGIGGDLWVGGAINALGNITAYASDERLKLNFRPVDSAIAKLKNITGYTFDWDIELSTKLGFQPDNLHEHGVKAQEIEKIIPDAVRLAPFDNDQYGNSKSGENYLAVQYDRLIPLLIEAVKELNAKVEKLEKELKLL